MDGALPIAPGPRGYALRRKSAARTRARNCSGVSVGGAGAGIGFTTVGTAVFAAFFAALRAASCASRLAAKSVEPLRPARHQGQCVGHGKARPGSKPAPFSS
jgi:hypothetical protein